jgi:thiamine phosphate synthase YjbQ (UPF0047 family)
MDSQSISVRAGWRPNAHDLTDECARFVHDAGTDCMGVPPACEAVFVPHATAGVAILETGAGSDEDLLALLDDLLPVLSWRETRRPLARG